MPVNNGTGTAPAPPRGRQVLPVFIGRDIRSVKSYARASYGAIHSFVILLRIPGMTADLYYLIRSPLLRHPSLGWRKFRKRIGGQEAGKPVQAPGDLKYACPAWWQPRLQAWFAACDLQEESYPWNRVFGREFPETKLLELCARGPESNVRGLPGDVKLPWEFSRSYSFTLNAARAGRNAEQVATDTAAAMERWLAANAGHDSCPWICAMEVAIRVVNWIFADVLLDGRIARILGRSRWTQLIWRHGETVWRRLETRLTTNSNHYLSNLLGLWVVGQCFPEDSRARRWRLFAQKEFPRALITQTFRDGALDESSLPYHALVTEMALLFCLCQADREALPPSFRERIAQMCEIVSEFRAAPGDVFCIGDDDGGRIVPLDFIMRHGGRADALLALARTVGILDSRSGKSHGQFNRTSAGWWKTQSAQWTVALEYGATRSRRTGCGHSHNDTLAVLAEWQGQPLLIDPGSYLYTSDPVARNEFRSVWSHSTLVVNGEEHNPLRQDTYGMFTLPDRHGPARLVSESPGHIAVEWPYRLPRGGKMRIGREVKVGGECLCIRDTWHGSQDVELTWIFHVAPGIAARVRRTDVQLSLPGDETVLMTWESKSDINWEVKPSRCATFYGEQNSTLCVIARLPQKTSCGFIDWRFSSSAN
jgi:hypothetical protein